MLLLLLLLLLLLSLEQEEGKGTPLRTDDEEGRRCRRTYFVRSTPDKRIKSGTMEEA